MQIGLPLLERKATTVDLKNKKVLVVGMGRSGFSSAHFLLKHGATVTATDIQEEKNLMASADKLRQAGVKLECGEHKINSFITSDLIILSPGVPKEITPLRRAQEMGIPVISEIELAYRFCKSKIIAVTGSNGKTTTVSLLGDMLQHAGFKAAVAGNIGNPFIDLVDRKRIDYFVVELSSFQLETIELFRPYISVLLNVTPDHMDRYSGFNAYAEAKKRIFLNQKEGDIAILNADDIVCHEIIQELPFKKVLFSRKRELNEGIFLRNQKIVSRLNDEEQEIIPIKEINLQGVHNIENIMAAVAVGLLCNADIERLRETFRYFAGLEHRLEEVTTIQGVTFYNDSKATNIDSVSKALESFDRPLILLMGGRDKGGDFASLGSLIKEKVKLLLLVGEASGKIASSLAGIVPIRCLKTYSEAIETGFKHAKPKDIFLFSPGCTSFDMFTNFEERGKYFKKQVINLKRKVQEECRGNLHRIKSFFLFLWS
jgi:UDP-N-acetylmuramoylalanine--D-glutamate ligase